MMDSPVTSVSCSYLHYHEKQHSSSQLMLGCEEDEASQHWPIEIMVMIHNDHSITVLNRWVWLGVWLILTCVYW